MMIHLYSASWLLSRSFTTASLLFSLDKIFFKLASGHFYRYQMTSMACGLPGGIHTSGKWDESGCVNTNQKMPFLQRRSAEMFSCSSNIISPDNKQFGGRKYLTKFFHKNQYQFISIVRYSIPHPTQRYPIQPNPSSYPSTFSTMVLHPSEMAYFLYYTIPPNLSNNSSPNL